MRRTGTRRAATALAATSLALALAACTGDDGTKPTSVFTVKPGECFTAPKDVSGQLSNLSRVSCTKPHTQEAYAVVEYSARTPAVPTVGVGTGTGVPTTVPSAVPTALPSVSLGDAYPGEDKLNTFAQGACAQSFRSYVGVDYLDSSLYFTFLLPSARSWEQADDRAVLCFITTTGRTLDRSVKGSRR